MKTREPKAAVPIGGRPMAARIVDALRAAGASRIIAVVGHRADDVRAAIGEDVKYVVQEEQLGTGHATRCAQRVMQSYEGPVLVTYADVPLLPKGEIERLIAHHVETGAAATLLTAIFEDPGTLGRIVRAPDGRVRGIVEARDATKEELAIKEINVGVYCFEASLMFEALGEITNDNAQRQFYLTDTIRILVRDKQRVEALTLKSSHSGMGVDTDEDLARAQRYLTMGEAL